MGVADPHCHTRASDGMVTPGELVRDAIARGLDLVAVTDHDTVANARDTRERGEAAGLAVVPGQEVTTGWPAQTHVLAWFVETHVRGGMSLADTVEAIHDQGGLAVIPHPFMPIYFASCQPGMLARLIEDRTVDGIELVHTAPSSKARTSLLQRFYAENSERLGAAIGASDSHFGKHDLGRAVTEFPGSTAEDFRAAVVARRTVARTGRRDGGATLQMRVQQQYHSLIELPLKRLRGQL